MGKHFAEVDSEGPTLVNYQLTFWRLALGQFAKIADCLASYGVDDAEDNSETEGEEVVYDYKDFAQDAAVAIVLAGTSVAEIVGQNVSPSVTKKGMDTPFLGPAIETMFGSGAVPPDVKRFIVAYNALRHFGPAKYAVVRDITARDFCEYMTAAQTVWQVVLRKCGRPVKSEFQRKFALES